MWNKVSYSIKTRGNKVSLKVNGERQQCAKYNGKFRPLQRRHKTSIFIGGRRGMNFEKDKKFIGCMKSPTFIQDTKIYEVRNKARRNVKAGCVNLCKQSGFQCHDGTCINHYDHFECNCYMTKYFGNYCHLPGFSLFCK